MTSRFLEIDFESHSQFYKLWNFRLENSWFCGMNYLFSPVFEIPEELSDQIDPLCLNESWTFCANWKKYALSKFGLRTKASSASLYSHQLHFTAISFTFSTKRPCVYSLLNGTELLQNDSFYVTRGDIVVLQLFFT